MIELQRGGSPACDTQVNSMVTPYIFSVLLCTNVAKVCVKMLMIRKVIVYIVIFKSGSFCAKRVSVGGRFQMYEGYFAKVQNLCLNRKSR
jgi:hypothetical protein